jgi:thiamine-phosphate pyrophosphorylase
VTEAPTPQLPDALRLVYIVGRRASEDWRRLESVLSGGVTAVWLRMPDHTGAEVYRTAKDLLPRCRARGVALVVGDRADVALAVEADGVQLGHRSPPCRRIRPWFARWIGVSCHSEGDLRKAADAGADYAVLSPVFGVPHKGPPLGTAAFQHLRRAVSIPVVALGGIDPENAPRVREVGASGVAVIRALERSPDPEAAARALSGTTSAGA